MKYLIISLFIAFYIVAAVSVLNTATVITSV
jgi:hypothetical protein